MPITNHPHAQPGSANPLTVFEAFWDALFPAIKEQVSPEFLTHLRGLPSSGDALWQLGEKMMEFSRYREASEAYLAAINEGAKHEEIYFGLGGAYLNAGDVAKAIEAFENAVEINPAKPDGYFYLANAYDDQGKTEKAIEAAEKALLMDDDFDEARMALAFIHYRMGNRDAVKLQYEILLSKQSELASRLTSLLR